MRSQSSSGIPAANTDRSSKGGSAPRVLVTLASRWSRVLSPRKASIVFKSFAGTAVYNATGIRVRNYPITLDKLLDRLPPVA
jgi:hypothetical protein